LNEAQTVIAVADPRETTEEEGSILREQLLTAEERESVGRLLGWEQQHERVIARSLVRLGLSSCFAVAPNEWNFLRDKYQKPFVSAPEGLPPFQFSLSHTRGLVALLITPAANGGVDVEQMERTNDLPLVATRICAASELESLNRLSGDAWKERFFELWTLKEAYAKARGLGLSLPWHDIAFNIDADRTVSVRFGSRIEDTTTDWQFWLNRITPTHIMSAAVRGGCDLIVRRVRVQAADGNFRLETQS